MMGGLFITLEGPDGTGKSTLARMLVQTLRRQGYNVVSTSEPGDTPLGKRIRELLLDCRGPALSSAAEILLYAADRAQHVSEVIQPALKQGRIVLAERYVDSSLAYQGYGLGWDIEQVRMVNHMATGGLQPDLTFLLDPGEEGLGTSLDRAKRAAKREAFEQSESGDRIEQRGDQFYHRVRLGYLALAAADPGRYRVIPCHGRSLDEIHTVLADMLLDFITRRGNWDAPSNCRCARPGCTPSSGETE